MNRLFAALSETEMYKSPPRRVPRASASRAAIQLGVRAIVVAPPMSTQEAETETLSPKDFPQNVSPFGMIPQVATPEVEEQQVSPESACQDASPCDVASPSAPDLRAIPQWPLQEAVVAQDSQPQPFDFEAACPVPVKVPPESRLVALTDSNSLGAEKFRALVTRLEHLHKQSKLKSLQVTSSVINEGKTLVSGNVAVTLAKYSGCKTLLIEGDLHRPTLASIFGLNKLRGLSHWWSGPDQDLAKFVHKLDGLPMWFLPAGGPCDRPSDILRSPRFVNAFAQVASQFEWIVVDSTPMLPIVDVNLWSRLVDGTLLVVREGVTPVKALKQGLRALDHPNLIGLVMNDASATDDAKYDGEYYGSPKRK